jgi:hypothetical protein
MFQYRSDSLAPSVHAIQNHLGAAVTSRLCIADIAPSPDLLRASRSQILPLPARGERQI